MTEEGTSGQGNRATYFAVNIAVALVAASAVVGVQHLTGGSPADMNKAAFEKLVRDYVLEHPEILPEAIRRLETNTMASLVDANRKAIEKPYAGSWEGNPNGDVTVVEFFDYACGACRAALPGIAKLVAEDKNLKVVYREWPVLSEDSALAARVSLLAARQGKYMAFHRAMYAAGKISKPMILQAASRAGLNAGDAEAAMSDASLDTEISNNSGLAQALKATGTPLFVIGNQAINDALDYERLKDAVAKSRAES